MRLRIGASGAEKLCALGAMGASVRPLNFTVRRQRSGPVVTLAQVVLCNGGVLVAWETSICIIPAFAPC